MQLDDTTSESVAASLLPDQGQGVPSSKLVYDDAVDTSTINQVLFIDSNVQDFQNYANANTFPIIYDRMCTREQMLEVLSKKFTSISRIAFVNHFSESPYFLNQESLFSEENKQFALDIITQFHVQNVDYLACSTLLSANWLNYYAALQSASTSVIIGASDNNTGNIKYGGDWIMESTHEDIHAVYFNDQIQNYASLLITANYTYLGSTFTYTYTIGGTTASVTAWVSGTEITIPSTIDISGSIYNVTNIGNAFTNLGFLTSITILANISGLYSWAFSNCTNITFVILPSSVRTIGQEAFRECTKLVSVNIPNEVYSIATFAFYNCKSLTSINIPGITSIGNSTYMLCSSLTSVTISSVCTNIGQRAFKDCTSLTSVILHSSFLSFGPESFQGCVKLTSMVMPSSVTSIGNNAFQFCRAMTSVVISPLVKNIPDSVFNDCPGLTSIVIPSGVTNIGVQAFAACINLTSMVMPASVKTIGLSAFIHCVNLTYLVIPPVTSIADSAFCNCVSLTSITIPSSVTSIAASAFNLSANITKVYFMGNSIPAIGLNNFTNATDTAYYLSGAANTSALTSRFTTLVPLSSADLLAASSATPPEAPTIISITAGNTTASVNFTAGAANGSNITNYQYSKNNGTTWTALSPASTANPILISGLTNGQTYQIQLKAVNGMGASNASAALSVIPFVILAPAVPTITSITIGNQSASIAFIAGAANGSAITNYEYSKDNSANWIPLSPVSTTSPILLSGLTNGQTYQVQIRAVNNMGTSPPTAVQSVTPSDIPDAPTDLSATAGNGQATITFTAGATNGSAITNYQYSTDGSTNWTAVSSITSAVQVVITGLTYQTYTIYLRAVNGAGNGAASLTSATTTPYLVPDAPTMNSVVLGDQSATINFTAGAENGRAITNYQYTCSSTGTDSWTTLDPSSITSPIIVSNLTNGATYSVKLKAISSAGSSAASAPQSVTPATAPAAPSITSVTAGNFKATINITANATNGSAISNYKYTCSSTGEDNWITLSPASASTTIVVTGLSNETLYSVKVIAVNGVGDSVASSASSVTPSTTAPDAPTITGITTGNGTASIAFTTNADNGITITNYKYSTDGGTKWTMRDPISVATPLLLSNLVNGTACSIQIKAINEKGSSVASNTISATPASTPDAPTIASISAGNGSASVAFIANETNGSAITGYKYSIDSAAWVAVATTNPIALSGLTNNQTYSIRILAVNAKGDGSASTAMSVTPAAAPAAPSVSSVTAGNDALSINFSSGSSNGSAIKNYKYSTDNGTSWTTRTPASVASPLSVTSKISNGSSYNVILKAINDKGVSSVSNTTAVTAAVAPAAPTITAIKSGDQSASIYYIAGAANGSAITGYQYSKDNGTSWTSSTANPIVVSSLTNNQTYSVKLIAVNGKGNSLPSDVMQVTPAKAPAAPTITSVTGSGSSITINFTEGATNGSPIINYKYSTNGGVKWTLRTQVSAESPIVVSKLTTGATYSVQIKAINAKGVSVESNAFSITL